MSIYYENREHFVECVNALLGADRQGLIDTMNGQLKYYKQTKNQTNLSLACIIREQLHRNDDVFAQWLSLSVKEQHIALHRYRCAWTLSNSVYRGV